MRADGRPAAVRPVPSHALTEQERQAGLETTLQPDYAALPCLRQAGWSGDTRNWGHIRAVWLNPENDKALKTKVAK